MTLIWKRRCNYKISLSFMSSLPEQKLGKSKAQRFFNLVWEKWRLWIINDSTEDIIETSINNRKHSIIQKYPTRHRKTDRWIRHLLSSYCWVAYFLSIWNELFRCLSGIHPTYSVLLNSWGYLIIIRHLLLFGRLEVLVQMYEEVM